MSIDIKVSRNQPPLRDDEPLRLATAQDLARADGWYDVEIGGNWWRVYGWQEGNKIKYLNSPAPILLGQRVQAVQVVQVIQPVVQVPATVLVPVVYSPAPTAVLVPAAPVSYLVALPY